MFPIQTINIKYYRNVFLFCNLPGAEADEELMMRYLDGEELTEEEISAGLHDAILNGNLIPVFAGSATKDIGITELMNGIVNLSGDPLARKNIPLSEGELEMSVDGDGAAFVFKTVVDPFTGQLSFLRVYSGSMNTDNDLHNINRRSKERIGSFLIMNGKEQESVSEVLPGYIVAIAKLKNTKINDTLSSNSSQKEFPPIEFPKPTISFACYAHKRGDEDKISTGLHRLSDEDPTVRVERQPETREVLLSGLGDQHLVIMVNQLKENFNVEVDLKTPKVPYRETITKLAEGKYRHKTQT